MPTTSQSQKDDILLAHRENLFPAVFHFFDQPLVLSHAKNQYVWDIDGNQYLDFLGGIVTISVGHCNDKVNARVHAQIDRLGHVSTLFANEPQALLARKIASLTPGGGALTRCFFTNSGTEANETAVLAARCATGSTEIIALRHSYHGRSALGMALSGTGTWRLAGSAQPGVVYAHNAYCYRCPFNLTYPSCDVKCAHDLDDLIRTTTTGRIAAFIAEPIQGVGGYVTPPKEYFQIVQRIVRNYGGLFISDEVQTGWGRTGHAWFGIEQYGVVPDVLTSAKGLANGFPIGLTAARPEVAAAITGTTLSTFGGNPIATTAAHAVIDLIEEENLRANTASVGAYLRDGLEDLKRKHPLIGDVRGMGLLLAVELVRDRATKEHATAEAAQVLDAARREGLLMGKGGLRGNVLRLAPPMNITRADTADFLARFDRALASVTAIS